MFGRGQVGIGWRLGWCWGGDRVDVWWGSVSVGEGWMGRGRVGVGGGSG